MDTVLAFGAAIVSLRLAAELVRRHRSRGGVELGLWAASLFAFAVAAGALAWGSAAGWDERAFRIYYLFGGLLTAALLGAGSLARAGWERVTGVALLYVGLAIGIALSEPVHGGFSGTAVPDAQDHLDLFPARALAIAANVAGTLAVVAVALVTIRRRPLGNALVLAGVAVAALGSALTGLGVGESALFLAAASALLYLGFVQPAGGRAGGRTRLGSTVDQPRERSQRPPTV